MRKRTQTGSSAFERCWSLISITIPSSVISIDDEAFYYCSSLTSIIIPNSVTSIGDKAFAECSSLTSITIPNSVKSIGRYAFSKCEKLTTITFADTTGWYVTTDSTASEGTAVDVTNTGNNAVLFKETYKTYFWKKSE